MSSLNICINDAITLIMFAAICSLLPYNAALFAFSALKLVGCQEEHPPCKKLSDELAAGMVVCMERCANDLHIVQLMPLPEHHLLLHWNQIGLTFRMPAYSGCLGKEAVKQVSNVALIHLRFMVLHTPTTANRKASWLRSIGFKRQPIYSEP